MKILSRWDSSKVLFEDEEAELIKCLEHAVREKTNLRGANLSGANLRGANLSGANLRGANLSDAYLSDAYLSDAYLSDAYLSGANLSGANLSGADLRGAYLSGAYLSDAYLSDAIFELENVPVVEEIDKQILSIIEAGKGKLEMNTWHTCETTHCRAGWAVILAGEEGKKLEQKVGPANAGILIYRKSCPTLPIPDFYCDNETALEDMRKRAGNGC